MPARPLAPLFTALIASLTAPGCGGLGYDCDVPPLVKTKQIPTSEVPSYLKHGEPDAVQCEAGCKYVFERIEDRTLLGASSGSTSGESSTGAVTTSGATDMSTGAGTTISSTTADGVEYDYIGRFLGCSTRKIDADTLELTCKYDSGVVCGRRPVGAVESQSPPEPDPERAWLLLAAELEAMSVPAFTELAAALARHGAPDELRRAALRAADDERRHAAAMGALARARACEPAAPHVEPAPASDLEALATHNAVEGCVRETWGALLAAFQARWAADDDVRAAQRTIADDERAHAELAWQIDAWARTRLSAAAQARVDAARRDAARALAREVGSFGAGLPAVGLPNATQARALLRGLQSALW